MSLTDLYFKMRYNIEVNRVIRRQKDYFRIVMIPYPMTSCDDSDLPYIAFGNGPDTLVGSMVA